MTRTERTNANVNLTIDSKKIDIDSALHFSIKGLKVSSDKSWRTVDGYEDNRKSEGNMSIDSLEVSLDYKENLNGIIKVAADLKKKGLSEVLADIGKGNNPVAEVSNVNCHLSVQGLTWKEDDKNKTISWTSKDGKRSIDETADRFIDMELDSMEIGGKLNSVIDAVSGLVASCTTEEAKSREQLDAEKAADKAAREAERKRRNNHRDHHKNNFRKEVEKSSYNSGEKAAN